MSQVSIFSLALILTTTGAHFFLRSFSSRGGSAFGGLVFLRWIIFIALAGLIALLTYYTVLQYFTWNANGLSYLLLPPYQKINYFLFYALTEFWANYLLAAAIGLLGYIIVRRYTKQSESFFYPEEPSLCFLGFLLTGHPLWMFYSSSLLLMALLGTLITRYVTKTNNRVSFRYLWLPLAGVILILSPFLNKLDFVIYLRF